MIPIGFVTISILILFLGIKKLKRKTELNYEELTNLHEKGIEEELKKQNDRT